MKPVLLASIMFMSLTSQASDLVTSPRCEINESGEVYLVSLYKYQGDQRQQMTFYVGQETWQEPNANRKECERLRSRYKTFAGEKWSEKECGCFHKSRQNRGIVFKDNKGDEIFLTAQTDLSFRYFGRRNPLFESVVENDPICYPDPDPMCGH